MIKRQVIAITLATASLSLFAICVSASIPPVVQNKKTLIRQLTLVKEPVDISFNLKGQPVKGKEEIDRVGGISTEEFEGDPDWVRNLTLKVRNNTDKTITYLVINLHFPEVTKNGATALHQIFLGVDPDRKFPRAELRLPPHETIEIPLADRANEIKTVVDTAGKVPLERVTKLWVQFYSALFDDETLYETGTWFKRNTDQTDPRKWIKVSNP
jgi:hypothetical protein